MIERIRNQGFTLVELLVVISIISLLMSILVPCLDKAKSIAKRVEKKQVYARKIASSSAQGAQVKRGYVNKAELSYGKKRLSAENCRSWSESMEPEKRVYIM